MTRPAAAQRTATVFGKLHALGSAPLMLDSFISQYLRFCGSSHWALSEPPSGMPLSMSVSVAAGRAQRRGGVAHAARSASGPAAGRLAGRAQPPTHRRPSPAVQYHRSPVGSFHSGGMGPVMTLELPTLLPIDRSLMVSGRTHPAGWGICPLSPLSITTCLHERAGQRRQSRGGVSRGFLPLLRRPREQGGGM